MNRIILTLALPLLLGTGLAPHADARPGPRVGQTWVSGCLRCGCPVYKQRFLAGYGRHGQPLFRVRVMPVRHHCCPAPLPGPRGHGIRSFTPGLQPNHRAWSVLPPRPLPPLTSGRGARVPESERW